MMNMLQPQASQPMRAPAPIDPDQLKAAHEHGERMMEALLKLTGKPKGKLSKKDVFDAAADLIKQGSFSTADEKQALIGELAGLPDDEPGLRQAIGQHLLNIAGGRQQLGALNAG